MQGNGGGRPPFPNFGDPFAGFGGFGGFSGQRSMLSGFFGGRDPFDDPFFTRPFGGMFESGTFGTFGNPFTNPGAPGFLQHQFPQPQMQLQPQPNSSRGPIIEELNSDDEKEEEDKEAKQENPRKHGRSSKAPYVEDPDDEAEERKRKQMHLMNAFSRANNTVNAPAQPQTRCYSFQSSTVTYGGADGNYYTSSRTKRTGSDGLTIEERKEADTISGRAAHQISRGMHDKGHTVARKLKPDGRVDTMETLHNLNEDELPRFEETWKQKANKNLPGWNDGLNIHDGTRIRGQNETAMNGRLALPSTVGERAGPAHPHHSGAVKSETRNLKGPSRRPSNDNNVLYQRRN